MTRKRKTDTGKPGKPKQHSGPKKKSVQGTRDGKPARPNKTGTPSGRPHREKSGGAAHEILYGFHSVYEALRAGRRRFEGIMISQKRSDPRSDKVADLARQCRIPVTGADAAELDELTGGGNHQGICARVSALVQPSAAAIFDEVAHRSTPYFVLILESIEDPHNMGALIRTALCAGVDYIVVPKDRSARPSPAVSRSSAGAMEHARIFTAVNLSAFMRDLKSNGAWIFGLDAGGDKDLFEADLTGNIALVVGGEHKGLRPGVRKECDFIVSIPISGQINSLNASVAGGIAMYEAGRQRVKTG